ncbi:DUF6155 family protein [Carboxylicivirga marina]|uniref:Uncharacterized protein n=1 Tax=Carboxylicivirga marina TaxID=2800988 RepID=A0ABS1HLW3_9BACT|nr:DUF6155 family protein [Carboxylicivirga marina]MBK3518652.1 hypothetical protein [Carboxylicivirga marina]
MGFREVKSELNKLDKAELIKHIGELYKKYKPVKEYFDFYANPDEEGLLEEYKIKVHEAFYPKRGYGYKLSTARNAITAFKKLGVSVNAQIDLLLQYVESGVKFTCEFGDIDEAYYTSLENAYVKALQEADKNSILDKFHDRALGIVDDTIHMGWGFHDYLSEVFYQYYE